MATALALLIWLALTPVARAADINVSGACTLVDAITAANTDTATGGCEAGNGADTLILEPDRTSPRSAALFALNMLVGTPEGSTYTRNDYEAWLEDAGYVDMRYVALPGPTDLILGRHA